MKKRSLGILLSLIMVISLLTGCQSNERATEATETVQKTEEETGAVTSVLDMEAYTIAGPFPDTGLIGFDILRRTLELTMAASNGTFVYNAADLTADGVLSFVESEIAAGVEGLIVTPPTDSVLPTICTLCEEAGVYWGISLRSIADEEIKAIVEASPYYVGNCYEDEEETGYKAGKWMGEQGYKKIALISQAKGDTTCDAREVGLARACEEYGIEIVAESRGFTQASDATSATESFLSANQELDAIFYAGTAATRAHEATVKAIQDAGREEVKLVTIDFPEEMGRNFESGIQVYAIGLPSIPYDCLITIIKVINAIAGTPINDDGSPSSSTMSMLEITSVEDAFAYNDALYAEGYTFYDEEIITQYLFKWNNPDLNQESLQAIIDEFSPLN